MMWDKNVLFIYWKYTEVVFLCQQILNNIFIKLEKEFENSYFVIPVKTGIQ